MTIPVRVLFALLFLSVGAAPNGRPLETEEIKLEPFSAIKDCLPVNVKVEPSKAEDEYTLQIEAEKSLHEAIDFNVRNGVLSLGIKGGFNTKRVMKVTVKMPKTALRTIVKTGVATLVVTRGLTTEILTVKTDGTSAVRIFGALIGQLVSDADGSSAIAAEGKIEQARLDVDGTSKTNVYGLTSYAEVDADGTGEIYIDAAEKDVQIKGSLDGLGRVFFTQGTCTVDGSVIHPDCEHVDESKLPGFGNSFFSCGMILKGKVLCDSDISSASSRCTSAANRNNQFNGIFSHGSESGAIVEQTQCLDDDIEMFATV